MHRTAVYAGTFDPLTIGHLWMIERGAALFDRLIVAIGENPDKRCWFTLDERRRMLDESTRELANITTDAFTNQFLIRYAEAVGAGFILRGIRSPGDYEYERVMRNVNADLNSAITTVFLMPPREIAEVSSSMVKGLLGPEDWEPVVAKYVPSPVLERLRSLPRGRA